MIFLGVAQDDRKPHRITDRRRSNPSESIYWVIAIPEQLAALIEPMTFSRLETIGLPSTSEIVPLEFTLIWEALTIAPARFLTIGLVIIATGKWVMMP